MNTGDGLVYVLDDEQEMVKALTRLLQANHFDARGFTSVTAFLEAFDPQATACLILDVTMPELDGLDLQRQLSRQGLLIPIIFLTGHGDVPRSVRAIKAGATDFLLKPVDAEVLIPAVRAALNIARTQCDVIQQVAELNARFTTLSPREREVMDHVVGGQLNKQIAGDLGTGEQNIKLHRARVMSKMGVDSLADLVRAAELLKRGR